MSRHRHLRGLRESEHVGGHLFVHFVHLVHLKRIHRVERLSVRTHIQRSSIFVLVLLLPLHSSVLEPDLDLSFAQAKSMSDLDASPASQISIVVKLLLQLQRLISSVRLTTSFSFRCSNQEKQIKFLSISDYATTLDLFRLNCIRKQHGSGFKRLIQTVSPSAFDTSELPFK
jgi:hypothetical protein